jgi:hypothetical protein
LQSLVLFGTIQQLAFKSLILVLLTQKGFFLASSDVVLNCFPLLAVESWDLEFSILACPCQYDGCQNSHVPLNWISLGEEVAFQYADERLPRREGHYGHHVLSCLDWKSHLFFKVCSFLSSSK